MIVNDEQSAVTPFTAEIAETAEINKVNLVK